MKLSLYFSYHQFRNLRCVTLDLTHVFISWTCSAWGGVRNFLLLLCLDIFLSSSKEEGSGILDTSQICYNFSRYGLVLLASAVNRYWWPLSVLIQGWLLFFSVCAGYVEQQHPMCCWNACRCVGICWCTMSSDGYWSACGGRACLCLSTWVGYW